LSEHKTLSISWSHYRLAEPSVYFNAANGPWRIALAYY
ncbi:OmpG family monomeric porin, partial [Shigella sonnei]